MKQDAGLSQGRGRCDLFILTALTVYGSEVGLIHEFHM